MKVRIGSIKYDLIPTNEPIILDGDQCLGMISNEYNTIHVCTNYPEQTHRQNFWHEVVHGMMWELGMEELGDSEGFVDSMAKQLYTFFSENNIPKIYEYLGENMGCKKKKKGGK